MSYFVVEKPTPLLSTPHFKQVFGQKLTLDAQNLVREVEMIAFPGMVFEVVQPKEDSILEVSASFYPKSPLYIDERFGVVHNSKPPSYAPILPSLEVILKRMKSCVGLPYVWGGNYAAGIPEWKEYYPPANPLTPFEEAHWCFRGVDCSGLLYEATEGFLPRNTSELRLIGEEVSLEAIQPLDLFFYPGHVFILFNETEVIESKLEYGGVTITPLEKRLKEVETYTIRRFHPQVTSFQRS